MYIIANMGEQIFIQLGSILMLICILPAEFFAFSSGEGKERRPKLTPHIKNPAEPLPCGIIHYIF